MCGSKTKRTKKDLELGTLEVKEFEIHSKHNMLLVPAMLVTVEN